MNLYGQVLSPVSLRFNSASKYATESRPMTGIRKFGPYDMNLFAMSEIRCGLIYPRSSVRDKESFVKGLVYGEGQSYPGFKPWFRVALQFDPFDEHEIIEEHPQAIQRAAMSLATHNCDLVFVLVTQRNEEIYSIGKAVLLSNGIPCQYVLTSRLGTNQTPWVLANIALATYAKVGGTPWVVADTTDHRELIMGVSRAQDKNRKYVVGFVTLFNQDGEYLLLHSKTPVVDWSDYVHGLRELIIDAYNEYLQVYGVPGSLVIHFHKRPGYRELEAVEGALTRLGLRIPYAMVHLNEYSGFRLFDTSHRTYVPPTGLRVDIGLRRALLLLDGREGEKRSRMGVPNVWDVGLDRRSTMSADEFPRLLKQIQCFAKVNWRGFNAKSLPVTINYSQCICALALDIGLGSWNSLIANGKLREKAWFL
ncbi:MAG: hypothetical protein JXR84_14675 [Anaerolineae bacterium]|nr:hypothetical protein [Anaerolineae bacterium]